MDTLKNWVGRASSSLGNLGPIIVQSECIVRADGHIESSLYAITKQFEISQQVGLECDGIPEVKFKLGGVR
jgi:hypothetical protein